MRYRWVTTSWVQIISVTDAANDTINFGYSNGGDLYTITGPLGKTIQRFTDAAGRVISTIDPTGAITQFGYDNLDHLTEITDPNSGVTSIAYDPASNLQSDRRQPQPDVLWATTAATAGPAAPTGRR